MRLRIVVITHPSGDQLPMLVDDTGLPLPTPNEFIMGRRNKTSNIVRPFDKEIPSSGRI